MRSPRPNRAFTMIELIVVVVVLGLLAGIGVVAYNAVVTRSQERAATLELTSVAREASALAGLDSRRTWAVADFATALGDVADTGPTGTGLGAAGRLTLVNAQADSTDSSSTAYGKVSLALAGDKAGLAMRTATGGCALLTATLPGSITSWTVSNDLAGNCLGSVALANTPGTPISAGPVKVGATPTAPTAVSAVAAAGATSITLSWPAVTGATSYSVYRTTDGTPDAAVLAAGLTSPAYSDSSIAPGRTYRYEVTAKTTNESPRTSSTPLTLPPAAVTGLTASITAQTSSGTATWTGATGATGYTVEQRRFADDAVLATLTTTSTSAALTVNSSAPFYVSVVARNAGGLAPEARSGKVTPQYVSAVLADSPVAYYRLADGASATAVNSAPAGVTGRMGNASYCYASANTAYNANSSCVGSWATGPGYGGVKSPLTGDTSTVPFLNGGTYASGGGFLKLPAAGATLATNGLTFEAWAYAQDTANWARIVELGNGPDSDNIWLTRASTSTSASIGGRNGVTGQPGFFGFDSPANGNNGLQQNTWHHLVGTYSTAGVLTLYVDGVEVSRQTGATLRNVERTIGFIGRSSYVQDSFYKGYLAEVAIYSKTLTAAQVAAHYAGR